MSRRRRYPGVSWSRGWVHVHRTDDPAAQARGLAAALASSAWVRRHPDALDGHLMVTAPIGERIGGAALRDRLDRISESAAIAASEALTGGAR